MSPRLGCSILRRLSLIGVALFAVSFAVPVAPEAVAGVARVIIRDAKTQAILKEPKNWHVLATSVAHTGTEPTVKETRAVEGEASLSLTPGVWRLKVLGAGGWTPEAEVAFNETGGERTVEFWMWPTTRLRGRLSRGSPPLETVDVVFTSVDRGAEPKVPLSHIRCPVEASRFEAEVPAVVLDVQTRASGFLPRYDWSVDATRATDVDLAEWKPQAGASVSGRVTSAETGSGIAGARVRLLDGQGQPVRDPDGAGRPAFEAATDAKGFFQLGPIPPAAYVLSASKRGFADDSVSLRVVSDAESQLKEPLHLAAPAVLEVTLDPPNDPWGARWAIRLMKGAPPRLSLAVARAVADKAGMVRVEALAPGTYQLLVLGSHDAHWQSTEVELTPDSRPIAVSLSALRIEGHVRIGQQPLAAKLTFGGFRRSPRVTFESDADGRFTGYLPERGEHDWPVYVESADPPVRRNLQRVSVERSAASDAAQVEIVLPEAVIDGRVIDQAGRPITTAVVQCQSGNAGDEPGTFTVVREADGGRFRFAGLSPGDYQVWAEAREGRQSETEQVKLVDKSSITLVLRGAVHLDGQIVSTEGMPIPGAFVKLAAAQAWQKPHDMTTTGADGRFTFELEPGTVEVMGSAGAMGFGLSIFRASVPPAGPLALQLTPLEGTLELDVGASAEYPPGADLVLGAGRAIDNVADIVALWAVPKGGGVREGKLVLPALAPGEYTVCNARGMPIELRPQLPLGVASGAGVRTSSCASGVLGAGETLQLRAPSAP